MPIVKARDKKTKGEKKIKKQAKIQSHLRILLMMAQVFNLNSGEERQEDLLNSRPACMVYTESSRPAKNYIVIAPISKKYYSVF